MKIENLLREEIQSEIEELGRLELGSEQYNSTVDGVTKLIDRVVEMEKLDIEHQERIETRDEENRIKMEEIKVDKRDSIVRNIVSGVGIALPLIVTVWGTKYTTNFEKEDSVTTTAGRQFFGNLFRFKNR